MKRVELKILKELFLIKIFFGKTLNELCQVHKLKQTSEARDVSFIFCVKDDKFDIINVTTASQRQLTLNIITIMIYKKNY
uniref:CSON013479 protein n=1 Tax=Culicoides sonorensis TaxID=179676 RepID=A0A336K3I3_CULSO